MYQETNTWANEQISKTKNKTENTQMPPNQNTLEL